MIKKLIKLTTITDVREFNNIVTKFDCDVDIKSNHYVIDAKSIMGIFTLSLSNPVEVVIHSDNQEYADMIVKWVVDVIN